MKSAEQIRTEIRNYRETLVAASAKYNYSTEKLAFALSLVDGALGREDAWFASNQRPRGFADVLLSEWLQFSAGREAILKLRSMK